jgi:hypothetical protein
MEKMGKPPAPIQFDGMTVPPFPPLREDAKKRFEEIRDLEYRKDDVILAVYPKSGIYNHVPPFTDCKNLNSQHFVHVIPGNVYIESYSVPYHFYLETHKICQVSLLGFIWGGGGGWVGCVCFFFWFGFFWFLCFVFLFFVWFLLLCVCVCVFF